MSERFDVAVVGGSRGIGLALGEVYARRGLRVALAARSAAFNSFGADEIILDVRVPTDWKRLVEWLESSDMPRLVVVTAAVLGPVGPLAMTSSESWSRTIEVNLIGPAIAMRELIPVLSQSDRLVFFMGGGVGGPGMQKLVTAYTTSKMGLASLIESVAQDPSVNVPIVGVAPGSFPTSFTKELLHTESNTAYDELENREASTTFNPLSMQRLVTAIDGICGPLGYLLNGRILAAQRDDLEIVEAQVNAAPSLYRMRRVDQDLFVEGKGR